MSRKDFQARSEAQSRAARAARKPGLLSHLPKQAPPPPPAPASVAASYNVGGIRWHYAVADELTQPVYYSPEPSWLDMKTLLEQQRAMQKLYEVEYAIQRAHRTSEHAFRTIVGMAKRNGMAELVRLLQDQIAEYTHRWDTLPEPQREVFYTLIRHWQGEVEECFDAAALLCEEAFNA